MGEDVEAMPEKPPNTCCTALKKKYSKLVEKYSKLEELKNKFRDCTTLVQQKYDVIERENESLKKVLEELKMQANRWKDEKETESGIRVDLEDEVSALKDQIQSLKQNGNSFASQEANEQLQERVNVAEKEVNQLKELLEKERGRAASEKKNMELERKKANEAYKKVEMGKNKACEAQKVANIVRKKAEDEVSALKDQIQLLKQNGNFASQEADEQLQERLNVAEKDINQLKELLENERGTAALEKRNAELERKKANDALKKVEMGKSKASEAQKVANIERKKAEEERKRAEENRLLFEKLKMETDALKSMLVSERCKSEAAEKKVEAEKQKALRERKRADLAVAKAEEQRELAEANLKKAMSEKDRADDLSRKLEEVRNRAEKLEELRGHLCSGKLVESHADKSNTGRNAELTSNVIVGMVKSDALMSQWMEKMLLEKDQNIIREKKRADSETKKAKKQRKLAKAHKRMAKEEKLRAEQLSRELESYKLRLEEWQKKLHEFVSYRIYADNSSLGYNNFILETDTVKLLKKQLDLEKMLVKHAKKATKVEAVRNNTLHQELFHLKQECLRLQQRLDLLDGSFLHGGEGIQDSEKIGNQTSTREKICSDGNDGQLTSGIDSRLNPPYRGSYRKMLQRSALNSSSASFSDHPLVGSQERGTFSVTTSAKLGEDISNLEPAMTGLPDKMRIRHNEHAVAKAANSIRSPAKGNANDRRVGYCNKKRILDAVQSIEYFHSKGEKLHQRVSEKLSLLHDILNGQKDEPAEENLQEKSCRKHVRPFKRRKISSEGTIVIHDLDDSGEPKSVIDSDIDHSDACMLASPPGFDVMNTEQCFKDGMDNILGTNQCIPQSFDEMELFDYMKLLDLDNAADEQSYRRAVAMPLSPILPEVRFHGDEKLEVHNPEMLVDKTCQKGVLNAKDNLEPTSSFDIIGREKNPTNLVSNDLVSSQLQTKEDSVELLENMESVVASDAHFHQIHVYGGKLGMSDLSGSGNEGTNILCENRNVSNAGNLKYFVVSSDNKDNHSILRILQTIGICMPQCSLLHSAEIFLRSILPTLLRAEDLSMKEKVCVFVSIMLHGVSEVGMNNMTNVPSYDLVQSLDSLTLHIRSALSDLVLRSTFMESCDLFELLALIEDFLLQRKVLVCGDVSAESEVLCSSKLNLVPNGKAIMLSEVVAPAHLLVAGGSLLASLCLAVDHIGYICEMSCNIFMMQKFDPVVVLAVLHAFAHLCGSKYLNHQQYTGAMTVVKSLITFLEKQTLSTNSTCLFPSIAETSSKIWVCSTNCPFLEGAASMEDVALLLLEKLQKYGQSVSWPQDSLEFMNLLVPKLRSHEERTEEVSTLGVAVPLGGASDESLCDFIDILSLVEIVASFMSWNWTFDNIIGQICGWLESHLVEGFSAAIIILIGQLGRLGVGASGYEDAGVKKLRGSLHAFLCQSTFIKLSLPVQFAIITAFFGLTPIKFQEIVEDTVETQAIMSQSIPANFIREWFSLLSNEQQSLFRLHQTATESNCGIGFSPSRP